MTERQWKERFLDLLNRPQVYEAYLWTLAEQNAFWGDHVDDAFALRQIRKHAAAGEVGDPFAFTIAGYYLGGRVGLARWREESVGCSDG